MTLKLASKTEMVTSRRYDGKDCVLLYVKSARPVMVGARVSSGGDRWVVTGGRAPHKPESTGRVWVRTVKPPKVGLGEREFFPSVFSMRWVTLKEYEAEEAATRG